MIIRRTQRKDGQQTSLSPRIKKPTQLITHQTNSFRRFFLASWRNRSEFFNGRDEIREFLRRKWAKELDYKLKKELWNFTGNRISVRFEYEWHDTSGQWYRSYGNEQWEFATTGLMQRREASINDVPIKESERKFR